MIHKVCHCKTTDTFSVSSEGLTFLTKKRAKLFLNYNEKGYVISTKKPTMWSVLNIYLN